MKFHVIDINKFDDTEYAYGEQVNQKTGDFERCNTCGSAISMRKWLPPLEITLSKDEVGDFIFGSFPAFIVSANFKNKYSESNLYGINEFEKVTIITKNKKKNIQEKPMNYYYVNIVQSNIRIDEKLSNFIWKREPTCNSCRANGIIKAWNGIFIEEKTWEQYDIFYPIGLPSTVIVTENFLNFVKSNNLKNIKFTKSKDYKPPWPA